MFLAHFLSFSTWLVFQSDWTKKYLRQTKCPPRLASKFCMKRLKETNLRNTAKATFNLHMRSVWNVTLLLSSLAYSKISNSPPFGHLMSWAVLERPNMPQKMRWRWKLNHAFGKFGSTKKTTIMNNYSNTTQCHCSPSKKQAKYLGQKEHVCTSWSQ